MYLILFIFSVIILQALTKEECLTPNSERAECVSLYSCTVLIDALATHQSSAVEFVRKSHCGNGSDPMVCCGSTFEATTNKSNSEILSKIGNTAATNISALFDRRLCGLQHTDDYYRDQNDTTSLDEYPWIAVLLYKHSGYGKDGLLLLCGGTIINERYILTAATCIPTSASPFRLVAVRLAEYNIKNDEDCVYHHSFDDTECSTPEEYGIEKAIRHPNVESGGNDIGLIRLNQTLSYSDYVRPICLPTGGKRAAKPGDNLITGSFGYYGVYNAGQLIKGGELVTLITNEECTSLYNTTISENQICTKHSNRHSYFYRHNDKGYPLMFSSRGRWHVEGIWSWSKSCGNNIQYSRNTRVASHLKWIQENVRPWK